jgi:hypothetical protein
MVASPAFFEAHRRPSLLLFGALDIQRVGHRRTRAAEETRSRIGSQQHLVDGTGQRLAAISIMIA